MQGGGVKKWQNYVHVVVECPLIPISGFFNAMIQTHYTEIPMLLDAAVEKSEEDLTVTIIRRKTQGRVR